ncbi:MAG TPA: AbrB/MazE/SpoVT family DNA-binding domain-containing protein [Chloroflexi bacterium]|nr:AbrB/MazE/SpoVT family DNA-binding domain-containing protein [Chloroflexota bacterium]
MNTVTVSKKGWVVIPKKIRERYGMRPGTKVAFIEYGGTIALVPLPEDPIEAAQGILQNGSGKPLTEELLEERRREYEREEAKIRRFGGQ